MINSSIVSGLQSSDSSGISSVSLHEYPKLFSTLATMGNTCPPVTIKVGVLFPTGAKYFFFYRAFNLA
jgi:hypothetical protein